MWKSHCQLQQTGTTEREIEIYRERLTYQDMNEHILPYSEMILSDSAGLQVSNLTAKHCPYFGGSQGVPADRPLSDSLRCLPGSVIPGLQGRSPSE